MFSPPALFCPPAADHSERVKISSDPFLGVKALVSHVITVKSREISEPQLPQLSLP